MSNRIITLYTDGSCHTQLRIGAWAAILLIDDNQTVLSEIVHDTTHNRMELLSVIHAVEYLHGKGIGFARIDIHTDSQYVANLTERKVKLQLNNYITKKGTPVQNPELVQKLIHFMETQPLNFIKVAAHLKQTETLNYNREVDKIVRSLMRRAVADQATLK